MTEQQNRAECPVGASERWEVARARFRARCEELRLFWRLAEARLTRAPLAAEYAWPREGDPGFQCLAVRPVDGTWRLCLGHGPARCGPWQWHPVAEIGTGGQAEAAPHLPALELVLLESMHRHADVAERAAQTMAAALGLAGNNTDPALIPFPIRMETAGVAEAGDF
jgi:hypothetical protein